MNVNELPKPTAVLEALAERGCFLIEVETEEWGRVSLVEGAPRDTLTGFTLRAGDLAAHVARSNVGETVVTAGATRIVMPGSATAREVARALGYWLFDRA